MPLSDLDGRRRLIPSLEQVTCREPRVTPISSAISSRLLPRSRRFLICRILSGVNFVGPPRDAATPICGALFPIRLDVQGTSGR